MLKFFQKHTEFFSKYAGHFLMQYNHFKRMKNILYIFNTFLKKGIFLVHLEHF